MANAVYSNARAKALENYLLGKDRLLRMAESSTPEEALKILSEINFGEGVNIDTPMEFEKLLISEQNKLYKFISDTCADGAFKEFFLAKNDFHNAEALIKSKYLKIDDEKMCVPNGLYDRESMKEKVMLDEYKDFSKELADAFIKADGEFASGKATGSGIDAIFKRALYDRLYKLSKKNKYLRTIYSAKADATNISVALRTRNFAEAKDTFVEGGEITLNELKTLCDEPLEAAKEKCKFFKNGDMALEAISAMEKGESLSEFEKSADDYALKYLKKDKYSTDGIHPFMLYCYYKTSEINNVRIVMVGLINGLDKDKIKRRMRDTYEG